MALIHRGIKVRGHADNFIVLNFQIQIAADAAICTGGLYPLPLPCPGLPLTNLGLEGSSGTEIQAMPTKGAPPTFQLFTVGSSYFRGKASLGEVHGKIALNFSAGPHAFPAQNAFSIVPQDEGVTIQHLPLANFPLVGGVGNTISVTIILQLAISSGLTSHTIQRMIGQHQAQNVLPEIGRASCRER